MSKTIALTGATGFIGQHLIQHFLDKGWSVRALTRRAADPSDKRPNLHWVQGSLDQPYSLDELCDGSNAVIHCAGAIKAKNKQVFFEANAQGTNKVVTAAENSTATRFIHLSSLAARSPELSLYAASKRAGEEQVQENAHRLSWTILRPPAVYGPGDRETFKIMQVMAYGFALVPGSVFNRMSFIHATDLCHAISAVAGSDKVESRIIEISDGQTDGYNWQDISAAASQALGRKVRPLSIPRMVIAPIAAINQTFSGLTRTPAMLTLGKVNEMFHPDWAVPKNTLSQLTEWRPQITLEEGFRNTFQWYKEANWL